MQGHERMGIRLYDLNSLLWSSYTEGLSKGILNQRIHVTANSLSVEIKRK